MGSVRVRALERLFDGQQLREEGDEFFYEGLLPLPTNSPVELVDEEEEPTFDEVEAPKRASRRRRKPKFEENNDA
jgi:hypothetical protein